MGSSNRIHKVGVRWLATTREVGTRYLTFKISFFNAKQIVEDKPKKKLK